MNDVYYFQIKRKKSLSSSKRIHRTKEPSVDFLLPLQSLEIELLLLTAETQRARRGGDSYGESATGSEASGSERRYRFSINSTASGQSIA
ncbi:MAG: hypothetical protein A2W09_04565 [Deltaproteobacteria bacterium RBG_16_50_11]|nr:MAG: hypothetical protein A2W09_04565 [Deltaproteobacteria bacterium RBG_16_50_11]